MQPWTVCPLYVLSASGSQQQFQAGTDFTCFPKVSHKHRSLPRTTEKSGQTQEAHNISNRRPKAAALEGWDPAGLAGWGLIAQKWG